MQNQQPKDITCKKIAWTIRNFSTLKTNTPHYSGFFTVCGCAWKLLVYRGRIDGKSLSIFLEVGDASAMPERWSIYAAFTLAVVNQVSSGKSVKRGGADQTDKFHAASVSWGYVSFMPLSTLEDPSSGYISNDICILEVEFFSVRTEGFEPTSHLKAPKDDEVVDFKDLGKIEKSLVPLLDEVCSWHPSLLDCKNNRSRRFTEWAFTALGRVLQFLKNKKWKDMNEEACEQLRCLWEELEISRLELGWLEPLVKSALNMKGDEEKTEKVKKLKEKLVDLEAERNVLKEKLADIQQRVEMIRKDLEDEEGGFEEKDLDAEIGYGKP